MFFLFRDVLEGLARCCLHMDQLDEALRWAVKLVITGYIWILASFWIDLFGIGFY
jgi:hypothetical protein